MDRIFVTGGSGLLGGRILEALGGDIEVFYGFKSKRPEHAPGTAIRLDISSRDCIGKISALKPSLVFHTAALTNVDYCEANPEEAFAINARGAGNVALACRESGARMVHISTDYVFDGIKGNYGEDDRTNPLNRYGASKLESERLVAGSLDDFVIARTTVIFGWNRSWQRDNFATWVIRSLRAGREVRLVTDQFSNPTLAENLAGALIELSASNKKGTYHIVGNGCLSRYEFGRRIADVFKLDEGLIRPVTSLELAQAAPRPKKNCLSNRKAAACLGTRLLGADEALLMMKHQEEGTE